MEAPLAGSPAEAAGIMAGDVIMDIDGMPADQLTLDEITTLLRGPAGSTVTLTLAPRAAATSRGIGGFGLGSVSWGGGGISGGSPRVVELERARLPQPAVRGARLALPDGRRVSYLRVHYFSQETTASLRQLMTEAEMDGVAGYVLDLRNDPGEGNMRRGQEG